MGSTGLYLTLPEGMVSTGIWLVGVITGQVGSGGPGDPSDPGNAGDPGSPGGQDDQPRWYAFRKYIVFMV